MRLEQLDPQVLLGHFVETFLLEREFCKVGDGRIDVSSGKEIRDVAVVATEIAGDVERQDLR